MTPRGSELATSAKGHDFVLRRVEWRLHEASSRLRCVLSDDDVRAAQSTMGAAEEALSALVDDPWQRSAADRARTILSTHLLAADACKLAGTDTEVTASVLRRGADSARVVIVHERAGGVGPPDRGL